MQELIVSLWVRHVLAANNGSPETLTGLTPGLTAHERFRLLAQREEAAYQMHEYLRGYRQPLDVFGSTRFAIQFSVFTLAHREAYMPGKPKRPSAFERPDWKGFVERRLSSEELEAFDGMKFKPTDVFAAVDTLLDGGYNLKLSYSKHTKVYTATLIDQDTSRATSGYALSAADGTGYGALCMLLYKHTAILEGDWTPLLNTERPARRG